MPTAPAPTRSDLERSTVGRVIRRILPVIVLLYLLNFLDRTNISYAALRMNAELGLTDAAFGLAAGLFFRSDAAVGAASGALVVLAFLGNVFMPLTGGLLAVARFTPMYGIVGLARYPVTEGEVATVDGAPQTDSIWLLAANVAVWALVFGAAALLAARKATARR